MAVIKALLWEFKLGDVEDPEIYAAQPLWEWQQTESGKYCMEHCVEKPTYYIASDYLNWGFSVKLMGAMEETDYVFWKLKYSNDCTK